MRVLVTGSSGLIGSEAVLHYDQGGHYVDGIDNNQRERFFGPAGDTTWNLNRLREQTRRFTHHNIDIRDRKALEYLFKASRYDLIVHCAAQPSHDLAARIPLDDFDINAGGTINLLEATRRACPEAVFIHLSTNKVYGDRPNTLWLTELESRYDFADPAFYDGIAEDFPIDQSLHSLFGASKAAADLIAQEYGRYFGMRVGVFRGGCLTGPAHSGVEMHGFLSYLVKVAVTGQPYTIYGYKGKQVRDQIHAADVVAAFDAFYQKPRNGTVYNLGGGRDNSVSVLEAISLVEEITGEKIKTNYVDQPRRGDHICYISDLTRARQHLSGWRITRSLPEIIEEMARSAADLVHA